MITVQTGESQEWHDGRLFSYTFWIKKFNIISWHFLFLITCRSSVFLYMYIATESLSLLTFLTCQNMFRFSIFLPGTTCTVWYLQPGCWKMFTHDCTRLDDIQNVLWYTLDQLLMPGYGFHTDRPVEFKLKRSILVFFRETVRGSSCTNSPQLWRNLEQCEQKYRWHFEGHSFWFIRNSTNGPENHVRKYYRWLSKNPGTTVPLGLLSNVMITDTYC